MSTYVKYMNEINPKNFEIGQIVYFIDPWDKKHFDWGIVNEYYSDGYCLELHELRDIRTVEGVPIAEYNFDQRRRKLPKGWSYDTDLIHLGEDPKWVEIMKDEKFSFDKDNLRHLIDIGIFVSPYSQSRNSHVECDINKEGYLIKKTCGYGTKLRSQYACVPYSNVYETWQEAQKVIDDYNAELKRQAELSDYDWTVEDIDRYLAKWHNKGHDEEECAKIRKFLLSQKNVEEIVVRTVGEGFQWKYDRNKKWMTIEI